MTVAALDVTQISRRFGGLVALKDISFSVQPGEVVGLIGPNGAGKSTLFEILSGSLAPSGGHIRFFGQGITRKPAHLRRRAGLCRTFQKLRLFETFSARETIRLAALACSESRHDVDQAVDAILDRLRLQHCAERLPGSLTLADRKKVEIGRAIAGRCRILMLDEALSGLTREEADVLVGEILSLNAELGVTILVVEHVIPVVVAMARRLIVLNYGELIADGDPGAVSRDPAVVSAYLGQTRSFAS